jgi:similar to stage IV sporulation protein
MKIIYLLTEAVTIEVKGVKPERIINNLALKGIGFTSVRTTGQGCISLIASYRNAKTVLYEAKSLNLDAAILKRRGLLHFLKKFKKRYVLLSMPAICLLAVFYLSSFIWEIDVTGNKTLPDSVIIQALDNIGVGIGTNGLWLDNELIRSKALLKVPKLSWLTVRVHGSRALIVVRERRERPELIDESIPSEIIAAKTGVVEKITALAGNSVISMGDTVVKGQTLITGELKDRQEEIRHVRSLGEVWARTWYEKSLLLPLKHIEKCYTGREKKRISVKICNLRLNFYFNSGISYKYYDKITTEKRPEILGLALPFSVIACTYKEYEPTESLIDKNIAEQLLKDRLLQRVLKESGGAKMTDAQFEIREDNGCLSVSVLAECYEQIGLNRFY